ncbi:ABC transporter ATP-binding protein OS=Streptomyces microflavus OX=1919 GN=Smic_75950 PE=3 SV=1 [Streptomyces microflavus]
MIRFEQVGKVYPDGTKAVDGLSFEVAEGELVTLVGPSGCGKTTTMMMVNRLIEPTSGRILVDGEDIAGIDPVKLRRRIGYVIQQVGLFPHRTVLDNTATVPALVGWKRARARERAAELLDLVGLDPKTYGSRYPSQLSGGQRQRVGVARALAADPPVLLMDEPFGAVDPVVRERLQNEFLALQERVRKTASGHARHRGSRADGRPDRGVRGGAHRAAGHPGRRARHPGDPVRGSIRRLGPGLKRLSVTAIEPEDLDKEPPVARLEEPAPVAADRLQAAGARWAVVLNGTGELHGWVSADALRSAGAAGDGGRAGPPDGGVGAGRGPAEAGLQ